MYQYTNIPINWELRNKNYPLPIVNWLMSYDKFSDKGIFPVG